MVRPLSLHQNTHISRARNRAARTLNSLRSRSRRPIPILQPGGMPVW